ncbi:hypothetical protein ABFP33_11245 [Acinetobacter bereziniae]|uniref:hypothetical protein n=1 Tax=Acinetobacter bereziniae TaxID=106648 RepID=UPI00321537CD
MTTCDLQLKIIKDNIQKSERLRVWLIDIHKLEKRIVFQSEILNVWNQINDCDLTKRELTQIKNLFDNYLWRKIFLVYKINSNILEKLNELVSQIIERYDQELVSFVETQNNKSTKEDFRISLSNEVSKQFTLVGTTNIIAVLMKKVTDNSNSDIKILFFINCLFIIVIMIVFFNSFISNKPLGNYARVSICFLVYIFLIANVLLIGLTDNYYLNVQGVFFISAYISLYISVAFNSLIAFHQQHNEIFTMQKVVMVTILIVVIELIFFANLFSNYLTVAVEKIPVLHIAFFNMFL